MREAYEIIEVAMIINWCVVLRVQCTLGSTSFFALCFLSLPAQVTSVVLFNIGPVTPNRINGLFDSVRSLSSSFDINDKSDSDEPSRGLIHGRDWNASASIMRQQEELAALLAREQSEQVYVALRRGLFVDAAALQYNVMTQRDELEALLARERSKLTEVRIATHRFIQVQALGPVVS